MPHKRSGVRAGDHAAALPGPVVGLNLTRDDLPAPPESEGNQSKEMKKRAHWLQMYAQGLEDPEGMRRAIMESRRNLSQSSTWGGADPPAASTPWGRRAAPRDRYEEDEPEWEDGGDMSPPRDERHRYSPSPRSRYDPRYDE